MQVQIFTSVLHSLHSLCVCVCTLDSVSALSECEVIVFALKVNTTCPAHVVRLWLAHRSYLYLHEELRGHQARLTPSRVHVSCERRTLHNSEMQKQENTHTHSHVCSECRRAQGGLVFQMLSVKYSEAGEYGIILKGSEGAGWFQEGKTRRDEREIKGKQYYYSV